MLQKPAVNAGKFMGRIQTVVFNLEWVSKVSYLITWETTYLAIDSAILVVRRGIQANGLVIQAEQLAEGDQVGSFELCNLLFNCKMGIIMFLYLPAGCLG